VSAAYVLAWLLPGWGTAVRTWLVDTWPLLSNPWLLVPAFAGIFGGLLAVIELPLGFYGGYVLPHRYGQSTQTLKGWISDQLKGVLIGAPLGLVVVELLYLALRAAGDLWWLWSAAGLLLFNVLISNLAPVLIMPLFNKYVPLGDEHEELARRLMRLAEKARARVRGVYKFDMSRRTKAANAALTGIGSTRRIILGDTLSTSSADR
jgi:STE24 endopeptidase